MNNTIYFILGLNGAGRYFLKKLKQSNQHVFGLGRREETRFFLRHDRITTFNETTVIRDWIAGHTPKSAQAKLIFCSGYMVSYVLQEDPDLFQDFDHTCPELNLLKKLNSKKTTQRCLKEWGFNVVPTYFPDALETISEQHYPILIKWDETDTVDSDRLGKTFLIHSRNDFRSIELSKKRILQPYIQNGLQFSFGGYFNKGISVCSALVEQKRMYPRGASTCVQTLPGDHFLYQKLLNMSKDLIEKLNYTGFGEIEYLYDQDEGKVYVLEINPRTWGWITLLDLLYSNFWDVVIRNFENPALPKCTAGKWMNMPRLLAGNMILDFPAQFFSTARLLSEIPFQLDRHRLEWLP